MTSFEERFRQEAERQEAAALTKHKESVARVQEKLGKLGDLQTAALDAGYYFHEDGANEVTLASPDGRRINGNIWQVHQAVLGE